MRPGISEDDVRHAAEALEREGRPVSTVAVREKLGARGSYSTIQRHLIRWRATRVELAPQTPSQPPDEVMLALGRAAGDIWRLAYGTAQERVRDELARAASQLAARGGELSEAADEIRRLEAEASARQDQVDELLQVRRSLEDDLLGTKESVKAQALQAAALRESLGEAERSLRHTEARAERLDARLAELGARLQRAEDERTVAVAEARSAREAQTQAEGRVSDLVASLAATARQRDDALGQIGSLSSEQARLVRELAQSEERGAELQSSLTLARDQADSLRAGEAELKEALARHQLAETLMRERLDKELESQRRLEERLAAMADALHQWTPPPSRSKAPGATSAVGRPEDDKPRRPER